MVRRQADLVYSPLPMPRLLSALIIALAIIAPFTSEGRERIASHRSACSLAVSPVTVSLPATGGSQAVTVTATGICAWTPVTASSWIVLAPAPGGIAIGTTPNSDAAPRMGTVDVAGVTIVVQQDAMVVAPPANLLVNGSFDQNIDGWLNIFSTGTGSAVWKPFDADGSSTSGSVLLTSTQSLTGYQLHQCINVTPGASYVFSGKAFVPSGQDHLGRAILGLYEVDTPNCGNQNTNGSIYPINPPFDTWADLGVTSRMRSDTQSIYVILNVGGHKTPPFGVYFDKISMVEVK